MLSTSSPNRIHPLSTVDTSSLPDDGGPDYNRLIFEASPYLLQHATNPVDWYPWGDRAFALARERDLPVFLSIGYATCHWCHVMAHECFEDTDVATQLNQHFVAIKVDREERPDVDQLYMSVCQLMTGGGGWPLNLLLTPAREAFFAATYIPKKPRDGNYGLLQLLAQVHRLWRDDRGRLLAGSSNITAALRQLNAVTAPATLEEAPLRQALIDFRRSYDPLHGGFGQAPKFPSPHQFSLLLRLATRFEAPDAAAMALKTLRGIARGGIHDQLGGGIHRYSVDARWLVPHFEKMLYDQALCALAATEAWQVSPEPELVDFVHSLLDYLLRDLGDAEGGFCSGEDADTDGEEGHYYLWTPAEIAALLDPEDAELVTSILGITAAGNFEGRNILVRTESIEALAMTRGVPTDVLTERVRALFAQLLQEREKRVRPLLDDKVVCSWNGLAIAALARAGAVFGEERWLSAARRAAAFVLKALIDEKGELLRRWRRGQAAVPGFLEDYSAVIWGLIELHQATLQQHWLEQARRLTVDMLQRFDDGAGSLYDNREDRELKIRLRSWQDGAVPAGASMAAYALLRLGRLSKDAAMEERGRLVLTRQLGQAQSYPTAATLLLQALDFALGPVTHVTLEGIPASEQETWMGPLRPLFMPRLLLSLVDEAPSARARICHGTTCLEPVHTPQGLADRIREVTRSK